eukprot:gene19415-19833_t
MVLPGIPHHVTQRGNRREQTFFEGGYGDALLGVTVTPYLTPLLELP